MPRRTLPPRLRLREILLKVLCTSMLKPASDTSQRVLAQVPGRVVRVAKALRPVRMPFLLEKYIKELAVLNSPNENMSRGMVELIDALYSVKEWRKALAPVLNERFTWWASDEPGLEALSKLTMPDDIADDEYIPSHCCPAIS